MFASSGITSIDLSSLTTISGTSVCYNMFNFCTKLTSVSFPKLQTINSSALNNMFYGCNALTEIHFRTDAQATVEALNGYTDKFGASNATIYFDL
jgi:hypothetical protein